MNTHNIIVEVNEERKFVKITCSEGHHITDWDGVDYRNYTSARIMYCPIGYDYSSFYCIDEETHLANMEKHLELIEQEKMKMEAELINPTAPTNSGNTSSGNTTVIISGTTI